MDNPLVSICIPTYNGAQFIADAMDSILGQDYDPIEIIVSDDDSKDETLKIIDSYQAKTNFPIRIVRHFPSGIGSNWNNSLQHAQGDYIKFLFQDDVLKPDCIKDMVFVLENNPKIGLVACKRDFIIEGEENDINFQKWLNTYSNLQKHLNLNYNPVAILDKSFFKSPLFYKQPLNIIGEPSAVMFRRSLINKIGNFREDLKQNLDIEYWFRTLKYTSIGILNKKLIFFRIHSGQATQKNKGAIGNDSKILSKLLYSDYFWLVNKTRQKQLFLRHNSLGKLIVKYTGFH
ncbi:MAG: glycosyltransferase [Gelidibacter sp.]